MKQILKLVIALCTEGINVL